MSGRLFSVYTGAPYDRVFEFTPFGGEPMVVVRSVKTGNAYASLAESFVEGKR